MINFPSIEQFRNAITTVRRRATYAGKNEAGEVVLDASKPLPTIRYRGTVKLHGTNAGIVFDLASGAFTYQSRERALSLTQDNAGFMLAMMANTSEIGGLCYLIAAMNKSDDFAASQVAIFGEWCGRGIQKGVAITQLPKLYAIFAVRLLAVDGTSKWIDIASIRDLELPELRIFNILRFGSWEIDVDFSRPELAQNELAALTEQVEAACPAGKHFGVEGVGEGIVWQSITPGWLSSDYWFKVKGEKHSATKVKTLAPVDVEAVAAIHEFVDRTVTESRLEQGLSWLTENGKPQEITSMGDYLRWVYNDIIKEETDTIVASQIDPKKLGGPIANKARPWFVARLNAVAGLV